MRCRVFRPLVHHIADMNISLARFESGNRGRFGAQPFRRLAVKPGLSGADLLETRILQVEGSRVRTTCHRRKIRGKGTLAGSRTAARQRTATEVAYGSGTSNRPAEVTTMESVSLSNVRVAKPFSGVVTGGA